MRNISRTMVKRVCRRLTGIFLAAGILTGCAAPAAGQQEASSMSTSEKEVDHIVMTYITSGTSATDDLGDVVEEINKIARDRIGVEVEVLPVDSLEAASVYPLWITQGKAIDLMIITFQDITRYVEQSMLYPLDALLENEGQDILALSGEFEDMVSCGRIQGQSYGITLPDQTIGSCGGLWIPRRYLEEVDFTYDRNHIYSRAELSELFAQMKAKHPDSYPLGALVHPYDFSISSFFMNGHNALFNDNCTGVLDKKAGSTEIVNFYETNEYQEWIRWMRDCYVKGYIHPDAATNSTSTEKMVKDNINMSIPLSGTPQMITDELIGEPVQCLRLTPVITSPGGYLNTFWTIPVTAQNPDAAMRFLNLMYSDEDVINLFAWGIEGKHYVMKESGIVDYPEGITVDTTKYHNVFGLYGDQRKVYDFQTKEIREEREEFSAQAKVEGMEYLGFSFDDSSVSVEINQVKQVLELYLDPLESGSVDPDQVYPQFIDALYDAGLQKILDEKQRQFDAFLQER